MEGKALQAAAQGLISNETADTVIKSIETDLVSKTLNNEAVKAGIKLTQAQIDEIGEKIWKMHKDAEQTGQQIDINQFKEELKAEYPSIMDVGGKAVNDVWTSLERLISRMTGNKR